MVKKRAPTGRPKVGIGERGDKARVKALTGKVLAGTGKTNMGNVTKLELAIKNRKAAKSVPSKKKKKR